MTVVDDYISGFPEQTQSIMQQMRTIIHQEAPGVQEKISYGMPTFFTNGNLVHFAGYKKHIGFYPTPSAISQFEAQLKEYKYAKGSVQFSLDQPIPYDLIRKMVQFRVKESEL